MVLDVYNDLISLVIRALLTLVQLTVSFLYFRRANLVPELGKVTKNQMVVATVVGLINTVLPFVDLLFSLGHLANSVNTVIYGSLMIPYILIAAYMFASGLRLMRIQV